MHSPFKKHIKISTAMVVLAFQSACAPTGTQNPDDTTQTEQVSEIIQSEQIADTNHAVSMKDDIDTMFDSFEVEGAPGGAIVVMQDGKVLYERYYGLASLEMQVPISHQTVFNSGSVSKQFTAYAAMKLAQEGKIDLNADFRSYLVDSQDWGEKISVGDLIYHTNGIPSVPSLNILNGDGVRKLSTNETAIALVSALNSSNHTPGTEGSYSNTGYLHLADIVEAQTGQSLPDWLNANVFEPLSMTQTQLPKDPFKVIDGLAGSYDRKGNNWVIATQWDGQFGASNVVTTARDLSIWMQHLMDLRQSDPEFWKLLSTPGQFRDGTTAMVDFGGPVLPYAAGLYEIDANGIKFLSHGGSTHGFRTNIIFSKEHDVSVAITTNTGFGGASGQAANVMYLTLTKQGLVPPPPAQTKEGTPAKVSIDPDKVARAMGDFTVSRETVYEAAGRKMTQRTPSKMAVQFRFNEQSGIVEERVDGGFWIPMQSTGESAAASSRWQVDFSGANPIAKSSAGQVTMERGTCNSAFMRQLAGTYVNSNLDANFTIYENIDQWAVRSSRLGSNDLSCASEDLLLTEWEVPADLIGFTYLEPVWENEEISAIKLSVLNRVRQVRFDKVLQD